MTNNILALDQSSNITGYAIFSNGELIKYDKFDASKYGPNLSGKLFYIKNTIKNIIEEYNITEVVMEDIQMQMNVGNNVKTYKALAEVIGVISEMLYELQIPQTILLASSWKSDLGIKGKNRQEQKANAQKWVIDTYSIDPTQDESDAICIGSSYIKMLGKF